MTSALDSLLGKLGSGDAEAAGDAFRLYEPYLRMVVRRQLSPNLRAKFDTLDVIQSVWVHLLQGFRDVGWRFADANHLRAFLIQLTRHRFIDRLRRHRRVLENERPLTEESIDSYLAAGGPEPSDVLQADELWERLVEMCPVPHRKILFLKRDGATLAEIAVQTGLHEGSVRRILNGLLQRLAFDGKETAP